MASIPRRVNNPFRAGKPSHGDAPTRPLGSYGSPEKVRAPGLWPGITEGHDARCECSWAYRGGRMEVKVLSALCPVPEHRRAL